MGRFLPARVPMLGAAVLFALLSGGWYLDACNENTNQPPTVLEGRCDGEVCASSTERCKSGLKNVRHRFIAGLPNGSATQIYFGGQRTKWCWRSGSVTMRHTDFPLGWTSVVSSGGVSYYVWSSDCQSGNASCLVRAEFLARMEVTIPVVGVQVGVNETFCVGTRVYAGGAHSRNISGGGCPGSAVQANTLTIAGLPASAIPRPLRERIGGVAFSPHNLRHMQRTRRPSPELLRLLKAAYAQLSDAERERVKACAGLSPDAWESRGGSPCDE